MDREKDFGDLQAPRYFIKDRPPQYLALLDLQLHLAEYNRRYNARYSLVMPKRGKREGAIIGKASDNNHLLYQDLLDGILADCPRPLTLAAIRQKLMDLGEKPSTAKMTAPAYHAMILRVLDPMTKLHRGAQQSLLTQGAL